MFKIAMPLQCKRPKLSDLWLNTEDGSVFYRVQWSDSTCTRYVFAAYRVVLALYILGVYTASVVEHIGQRGGQAFLYLTRLAVTVFTVYLLAAAVIATIDGVILRGRRNAQDMGIRHKMHWLLFNITVNVNFIVTVIYWIVLYQPGSVPSFYNFNNHATTSIITTTDLFLTAIPVRFLHFIYPLGFCTVYLIMTLIFWGAGGRTPNGPIYPFIDYSNDPGLAVGAIFGVFAAILALHGLIWALYKLRIWIWKRCGGNSGKDEPTTQEDVL